MHILKNLSPSNMAKGIRYMRYYGLRQFWNQLQDRLGGDEGDYMKWYDAHRASKSELKRQSEDLFPKKIKFSIITPAYETNEKFLRQMVESVLAQSYKDFELCIADGSEKSSSVKIVLSEFDDPRIVYKKLDSNYGIVGNTNAAIDMASGDFLCFLDHDDFIEPDALYEMAYAINMDDSVDMLYTDEDKSEENGKVFLTPHFKPSYNPDLLRSNNYICHFLSVRKDLLEDKMRPGFDGAQDYDLILRCSEKAGKIHHISKVLYHWRTHSESTSDNPYVKGYAYDAGVRALEEHLKRCGLNGSVENEKYLGYYRVRYSLNKKDKVSVIIPNKDEAPTLKKCIDSLLLKSAYDNMEILIVENNSKTSEIFDYYRELEKDSRIRILNYEGAFNYSAINNYAAGQALGDYLFLLNNDTEVITDDIITELLSVCQRDDTGIVGCKLFYPDDTIQHAGTVVGIGGVAGHIFTGMPKGRSGYMHKASIMQDLSAVTAAALMIKKSVFEKVRGFDEKLSIAFNDVDLCMRVSGLGYLVVYDPYAELYHYESKSRGLEDNKEKTDRFKSEISYMKTKWRDFLEAGDPYYNINCTLKRFDYSRRQ